MSNADGFDGRDPEEFKRFLEQFMANRDGLDPEQLAEFAGLARDPEQLAAMIKHLQDALGNAPGAPGEGGVNWALAAGQAKEFARKESKNITDSQRASLLEAEHLANLWLNAATSFGQLSTDVKVIGRELWVDEALPLYQALAAPIADRMSDALSRNLVENAPEELDSILGSATGLIKSAGGAMFAMQLGQALGRLSCEVLSGGDIGLPLFQESRAAVVGQNLVAAVAELDVDANEAYIFLQLRELAHARLFKNAKWLRDAIVTQIVAYAGDLQIDNSRLESLAGELNTQDLDAIKRALDRIETLLALIEGWVQVVTEQACKYLPSASALGEFVRRRRATGGPAEKTFGQLMGLELRPRRLREAAVFWGQVTEALGVDARDAYWAHPDLLPDAAAIDNPTLFLATRDQASEPDDLDRELRDLLGE
jgi:putative hydrolase